MANDKSSLVQIAQSVLDQNFQAIKVVNADPSSGGATEATALEILMETEEINAKTPALDAGNVPVDVKASVLPTGAATEATLAAVETAVGDLATEVTAAAILADTADIEIAVESIDSKTPALGQALAAASVPVVLPAAQILTLTPQTDALTNTQLRASAVPVSLSSVPLPTGAATEATLSSFSSKFPDTSFGSAVSSARVAAVVGNASAVNGFSNPFFVAASSGAVFAVSATSLPLPTGAATETTLSGIKTRTDIVGHGSPATAMRVAADIGVGDTPVSNANPVPISDAGGSITIDGTVEASNFPAVVDRNFGTVGASTIRTAAYLAVGTTAVSSSNPVPTADAGGSSVQLASSSVHPYYQDFSSSSLTTSYTQVVASTGSTINSFSAVNNSATPIYIATGVAASEIVRYIVMPGETTGRQLLQIASGTRIAIRTVAGTESSGKFALNVFTV